MKKDRNHNSGWKMCLVFLTLLFAACSPGGLSNPTTTKTMTSSPEFTQTLTQTFTPTHTQTPIPTITLTPTSTRTPIPTRTRHPALGEDHPMLPYGEGRNFYEEVAKFGYATTIGNGRYVVTHGSPVVHGLTIQIPDFLYEGHKVTTEGLFILGSFDISGEEYTIEIQIDYNNSRRNIGNQGFFLKTIEDVEKIREGRIYPYVDMFFMIRENGRPVPATHLTNYTPAEWVEIRSNIDEVLKNGGRSSEYYLLLNFINTE